MRTKLLIFVMILFCSCGRKSTNDTSSRNSITEIDLLSESESTVKVLSDFVENIEYIPLMTTESSLIGPYTMKMLNIDNRIYIQNSGLEGEILCFDINGKFLFKISNKGRGPQEYDFVTDWTSVLIIKF